MDQRETELEAEVQAILPSGILFSSRAIDGMWVVDIVRSDGTVVWSSFGNGPDRAHALARAWQRYLEEEIGEPAGDRCFEGGANELIRNFLGRGEEG